MAELSSYANQPGARAARDAPSWETTVVQNNSIN